MKLIEINQILYAKALGGGPKVDDIRLEFREDENEEAAASSSGCAFSSFPSVQTCCSRIDCRSSLGSLTPSSEQLRPDSSSLLNLAFSPTSA